MEDYATATLNLPLPPTLAGDSSKRVDYFAVFDGHGGPQVARYASRFLHKHIVGHDAFALGDFTNAIRWGFFNTDNAVRIEDLVGSEVCGSTGCVALVTHDRRLFIGNAGDCRAVLSSRGVAKPLSLDHKPDLPVESARIRKAGGDVFEGRVMGELAVSRSLGDFRFKKNPRLGLDEQLVSSEPDVTVTQLGDEDELLIIACDGIWDVIGNQEAVDFCRERMALGLGLGEVCEQLLEKLLPLTPREDARGMDNMTVSFAQKLVWLPDVPSDIFPPYHIESNQIVLVAFKAANSFSRYLTKASERWAMLEPAKQQSTYQGLIPAPTARTSPLPIPAYPLHPISSMNGHIAPAVLVPPGFDPSVSPDTLGPGGRAVGATTAPPYRASSGRINGDLTSSSPTPLPDPSYVHLSNEQQLMALSLPAGLAGPQLRGSSPSDSSPQSGTGDSPSLLQSALPPPAQVPVRSWIEPLKDNETQPTAMTTLTGVGPAMPSPEPITYAEPKVKIGRTRSFGSVQQQPVQGQAQSQQRDRTPSPSRLNYPAAQPLHAVQTSYVPSPLSSSAFSLDSPPSAESPQQLQQQPQQIAPQQEGQKAEDDKPVPGPRRSSREVLAGLLSSGSPRTSPPESSTFPNVIRSKSLNLNLQSSSGDGSLSLGTAAATSYNSSYTTNSEPTLSGTLSISSINSNEDPATIAGWFQRGSQSMPSPGSSKSLESRPHQAREQLVGLLQGLSFSSLGVQTPGQGLQQQLQHHYKNEAPHKLELLPVEQGSSRSADSFLGGKLSPRMTQSPASSGSGTGMTPQAASLSRLLGVMARASVASDDSPVNSSRSAGDGASDYFSYVPPKASFASETDSVGSRGAESVGEQPPSAGKSGS